MIAFARTGQEACSGVRGCSAVWMSWQNRDIRWDLDKAWRYQAHSNHSEFESQEERYPYETCQIEASESGSTASMTFLSKNEKGNQNLQWGAVLWDG